MKSVRRRFGVELETSECDGYGSLRDNTTFGCKEDGSISGKEFISPVLSSDDGLTEIRDFCRLAHRFNVDDKCGFHLHIDARNLDVTTLKRVAQAYLRAEGVFQALVPESRRQNHYCQSIQWSASEVRMIDDSADFRQWAGGQDRYQWFNVHSYVCHKSLEIRLHSSTLEADKVCNWVKAHLRFVDWIVNGGDINRLTGTTQERFAVLSEIWADDELSAFYVERTGNSGPILRRFAHPPLILIFSPQALNWRLPNGCPTVAQQEQKTMCGIFGGIGRNVNPAIIRALAIANKAREGFPGIL